MNITKKLSAVLLCIVLCLTGCNSANSESSADTTKNASEQHEAVKLLVWESSAGPDEWIKQAADSFHEEYPYITVEFENVELTDNISTLKERRELGTAADLFAAPHDEVGRIVDEQLALPVKNAQTVSSKVLSVCTAALSKDGTMYGYPTSAETYALYYNRAMISDNEVPQSWDELYTYAEKFNKSNNEKYALALDVTTAYYTNLFATGGGNRLFGKNGDDTSSLYTDINKAIDGYKFLQKLRNVIDITADELTSENVDKLFMEGNAAMCISGPWSIAKYTEAGIDFGIAALPSLTGESTPACSFCGIRGLFVSSDTKHPDEAAIFAEFLTSQDMQKLRYEITGALPSIDLVIDNSNTLAFINQLEYACPMPSVPQMSVFWSNATLVSKAIWDGADVEEEIAKLQETVINAD